MLKFPQLSSRYRSPFNILLGVAIIFLACCLSLLRLPGMEILGISPNWLLIVVVSFSLNRSRFESVVAGLVLGAIQDGLTTTYPSHILIFALVGFLTARLRRKKYLREELIAVVLIVFFMTLLAEMLIALQYYLEGIRSTTDLWIDYQRIALAGAVLSSLWTPVLYYPLHQWWRQGRYLE